MLRKSKKNKDSSTHSSMQFTIAVSFSAIAIVSMLLICLVMYNQFYNRMKDATKTNAEQLLNQTKISFEDYLRGMRRVSDVLYYTKVKDNDFTKTGILSEFNLMYETEKDKLISIALYSDKGELISAVPVSTEKKRANAKAQRWFISALSQVENTHFSSPHVQNLFENSVGEYHWVISLSRAVELNYDGNTKTGVLLVDMDFSSIQNMLERANKNDSSSYIYMMDSNGDIIYHPKQKLINAGLFTEDNKNVASLYDDTYEYVYEGENRITVVKTIGYTGWKLVSVIPLSDYGLMMDNMQYLAMLIIALFMLGVILINQLISIRITRPLERLDKSIKRIEDGNLQAPIYVGGSQEIEHLGKTFQSSMATINSLMDDIVKEQEEKRISELDALQSQINPHFLYNTLDSVIWMIEGEKYDGAVTMVKDLASLMRISISRGRTIIPLRSELMHAESYMNIQLLRYKNTFTVSFDTDENVLDAATVKLIVQPILENAIYYGVSGMYDEGEIIIRTYKQNDNVIVDVIDNGVGMNEEQVEKLLREEKAPMDRGHRHGNGVGLVNVNKRIKLRFGEDYGLEIISEPDEGTTVRIRLPYIPYTDDLEERMKNGSGGESDE